MKVFGAGDVFAIIREQLKPLGAGAFSVHQGAMYGPPNLTHLWSTVEHPLIAPEHHSGYNGERALRASIAARILGSSELADHIVLCNGATNGLSLAFTAAVSGERRDIHVLSPYWLYLDGVVRHARGAMIELPTLQADGLVPEAILLERLERSISERSACIYLANPANPVGNVASAGFVRALVELCSRHDLRLVVDHAYYGFEASSRIALAPLAAGYTHRRVLNVFTFSKLFGIPGVRLGFVHAEPETAAKLADMYRYTSYTPNSFSQSIVHHFLQTNDWLADRHRLYQENLAVVRARLSDHCVAPDGGFFAFVRASEAGLTRLLHRGLGLVPGALFGAGYEGYGRFCFTSEPRTRLEICCDILREELSAQTNP